MDLCVGFTNNNIIINLKIYVVVLIFFIWVSFPFVWISLLYITKHNLSEKGKKNQTKKNFKLQNVHCFSSVL